MGSRAGLDGRGKSRPDRDSIPGNIFDIAVVLLLYSYVIFVNTG